MTTEISQSDASTALLSARQRWEAPAIVLERSLEVSAQDGSPTGPDGLLGPLSTSAGGGNICM